MIGCLAKYLYVDCIIAPIFISNLHLFKMRKATLVLIALAIAVLRRSSAENIKGAISLNSGTFDKVIKNLFTVPTVKVQRLFDH